MLSNSLKALRTELRETAQAGRALPPEAATRMCVTLARLEMCARSLELACPEAGGAEEPLKHLVERRRHPLLDGWVPVYRTTPLPEQAEGGAA